ncbi:DUF4817 domain-containing protein [Trichonephila clavipes]|nr:DUF4817 domain-containing protein [Trichonephila clavipes]
MATSTNKTAAFGVKLIHNSMSKHRYIQKTDCLVRFMGWWNPSSKTMKDATLQSMGYVKSLVYADKPQTLDHLEDNIRRVIADIRPQMLEKVIENWTSRLDYIRTSRGSHMPEIIFKRYHFRPGVQSTPLTFHLIFGVKSVRYTPDFTVYCFPETQYGAYRRSYCYIEEDPNESIRHRAQELDKCPSILWKILRKDLGLRAYQIQLVQELKPNDHQERRRFVEWTQNEIAVVPDFHKRILFSDEAHFWLNGYVNKQNCRIWSEAIPQVYVETPLHPEKLTVWCALWAGGILQKR